MTTATAAVANHLNIAEQAIAKIEEWAHVLFVRFTSGRPRFVSKKVAKVQTVQFSGVVRNNGLNVFVRQGEKVRLPQVKASKKYSRVNIELPIGTIVHVDTYSWNGTGKGQTGWFTVNAKGDLDAVDAPILETKTSYPHEIYEELSEGKNYQG